MPRPKRLSSSSSVFAKRPSFACGTMTKPALFNAVRMGIFIAVILWTVICLAIAVHFNSILIPSDLTHFVPFAIFVSSATLAIILILLGSTFLKRRSPVSTRVELLGLGLIGVLWLALGVFLAVSESGEADVECFAADDIDGDPVDMPGFSTETFQAQYRVLEAFSLFNVILVWSFFLLLLFLALREHRRDHKEAWYYPVPLYPWFDAAGSPYKDHKRSNSRKAREAGLPTPVTARGGSRSPKANEKAAATSPRPTSFWVWVDRPRNKQQQPKEPPKARTRDAGVTRERSRREAPRGSPREYGRDYGREYTTRESPRGSPRDSPRESPREAPRRHHSTRSTRK